MSRDPQVGDIWRHYNEYINKVDYYLILEEDTVKGSYFLLDLVTGERIQGSLDYGVTFHNWERET